MNDLSSLSSFLPLIVIFGAMYFFVIRPQSKKAKEHKDMLSTLSKGERILTSSGIIGTIESLSDTEAKIEIAPKVVVTILRSTIAQKVNKTVAAPAAKEQAPAKASEAKTKAPAKSTASKPKTAAKKKAAPSSPSRPKK